MAKKERSGEPDPSLAGAFFCEQVLFERDGTHSFIRVVDSIAMNTSESVSLDAPQTLTHPLCLAIVLRSRNASGERAISVRHTPPAAGVKLEGLPEQAPVEVAPNRVMVATVRLTGGEMTAGRHVFEVRLGGRTLANVPLEVHFGHTLPS